MRYAQIRSMDISNGEGVGVSLFVQGCPFHCKNCFNSDTWDFNGPYIKRVSFLGGECLADQNLDEVLKLVKQIRNSYPDKTIWLYTGFEWNSLMSKICQPTFPDKDFERIIEIHKKRKEIISNVDVLVDGEYIDEQKDLSLKFRGSKNQRVIDVKQSLAQNKVILYCD